MKKYKSIIPLFLAILILGACEDDNNNNQNQQPVNQMVPVILNYDFKYGEDDFALNTNYTTDSGYVVRFTLASFYLSKPVLMDDNSNMTMLDPEYYIIRPDVAMSNMGSIDPGHAHMFNVSIGIDVATNTESGESGVQPTDFTDASHPLAPQPEGMYWSWASGYIFVKIEGNVDYDGDGTFDEVFAYHLGTNDLRKDRSTMLHTDVAAGDELNITMKVDYAKFLEGINLNTERLTMSMGPQRALGIKMMDQFDAATSFSLGGGHGHGHGGPN